MKPASVDAATSPPVQWEAFQKAPITEALLDIRATLPKSVVLETLASLQDTVKERYPHRREQRSWEATVGPGSAGAVGMRQKGGAIDGYLFISTDQRQIVQSRLDGYTFNRLRPYQSWAALRDEAKEHWERYRTMTEPTTVSRLALRYVNKIDIPLTATDFKEYVRTTPEMAPGLPQGLASFLLRLVIPMYRFGCTAIATETMEPPQQSTLPFILDIDVFVEKPFPPDAPDIWETFERLRDCKNTVFFESITERAKELFR